MTDFRDKAEAGADFVEKVSNSFNNRALATMLVVLPVLLWGAFRLGANNAKEACIETVSRNKELEATQKTMLLALMESKANVKVAEKEKEMLEKENDTLETVLNEVHETIKMLNN